MVSEQTVLVIEDDRAVAGLLVDALDWAGYSIVVAHDGTAADAAAEKSPALVLLDVMLPGENGLEVFRRLRADPRTQRVPILFITALSENTLTQILNIQLHGYPYDGILHKPFELADLVATADRLTGKTARAAAPD